MVWGFVVEGAVERYGRLAENPKIVAREGKEESEIKLKLWFRN